MRITNNVLVNNLKNNLSRNIRNMERTQNQLATGKRISRPSEDPTGIVESLRLASRLRENRQFQENVKDASSWLTTTDEALDSLGEVLTRVYELTVQGANGPLAPDDRAALSAEVKQLMEEARSIANTTHGDKYIFGGTNSTEEPYDSSGAWHDNAQYIHYEIGVGVEMPVNITAQEVFRDANVFQAMQDVADHLDSDDFTALGSDLEPLQTAMDQVLSCRSKVGASVNRLEMTKARLTEQELNFANLQAEVDGVDPAQAIMELKNQENIYRASLAVGARVIMPTLVDFLR